MGAASTGAAPDYSDLPQWLKAARRFLLWRLVPDPARKKPRKVPYYVSGALRGTTDTPEDSAALANFDEALAALQQRPGFYTGIGFALGPDGAGGYFQGIDLDALSVNVHLNDEINSLTGYVERSPSGDGVHALGYGPEFRNLASDGSGVEAYARGRFFTITADAIRDAGPEDLSETVARLSKHRKVKKKAEAVMQPAADLWAVSFEMTPERLRDLRSALAYLDPDDRDGWVAAAYALYGGGEAAFEVWNEWSARSHKYDPDNARKVWDGAFPDRTGIGAVFKKAEANGWVNPRKLGTPLARHTLERAANDAAPMFAFRSAGDLIAALAPPKYLVHGIIEEEGLGLLFGDPGLGKSFLAIDWACSIATGTAWMGRAVASGPVFYIAGEGLGGMSRRLAAWGQHHEVELANAPLYVSCTAAAFMDVLSAAAVAEAVEALAIHAAPKLVVIDTLHRNLGPGDENSAEDIAAFLNHVDLCIRKKFDCTVLIVHHSGHSDKSRARGSSSITGGMDFIFHLSRAGTSVELSCDKQKDGEPPPEQFLRTQLVDLSFMSEQPGIGTSLVLVPAARPGPADKLGTRVEGRCLLEVLEAHGEPAPAGLKFAAGTRVVQEESWKAKYVQVRSTEALKAGSAERAFSRKKKELLDAGLVAEDGGWFAVIDEF